MYRVLALLALLSPFPAPQALARDHLIRWIAPPEPDVAGYRVFVSLTSGSYGAGSDIGFHVPDSEGIASYTVTGLEPESEYFIAMTAYDDAGNESIFSNEIRIAPVGCSADAECGDGDACNGAEICQAGTCVAGTPPVCPTSTQCMQSSCDAASGCVQAPEPDGTACNDGNPATVGDMCTGGACGGVIPECLNDADCGDGDACNGAETCSGFSCVAGSAPVCAAPTQCTTSSCDPASGCRELPEADGTPCDDGDPDSLGDACQGGVCTGTVPECDADPDCADGSACTVDRCDAERTCQHLPVTDGSACYDHDPDTIGDFCLAGVCEYTCRVDVDCPAGAGRDHLLRWSFPSEPGVAGFYLYLGFEDGVYGEPVDLGLAALDPDGMPVFPLMNLDAAVTYYAKVTAYDAMGVEWLLIDEIVIPALACDPAPCDDLDPCSADSCAVDGCTNESLPDGAPCDDGDDATLEDVCVAGICTGLGAECSSDQQCDDGDACNGAELCVDNACAIGMPPTCPTSTECASSVCDAEAGCVMAPEPDGTLCDDGDGATVLDVCQDGTCAGLVPQCTVDADCDDGDVCTGMDACQDFACTSTMSLLCAPSHPCMQAFCDAVTGCGETPLPDGTTCDDGDSYTKNDVCSGSGTVCAGVVPQCKDVACKKNDFWCEMTKILSKAVSKLDKDQKRPCL